MRDQLLARICQYLEQPITSSTTHGSALAVATLTTVFNVLPADSESRYHVFLAIVKVIRSRSSQQAFDALIPQLEANIESWTSAWQLDDEDVRNLYVSVADVAAASGDHDLSYKYNLRALETIAPAAASETEIRDLAKKALSQALSSPTVTDFTPLTASDAIQALRKSDSALFELLEVFSSDDYSAYADFLETNELSKLGFSESAEGVLSKKIRLLTLASIAASTPTRSVPYSTIASSLQISAEDVEMWVIDTIRAGLVEGKLSQLRQEFLVQRATYRVFGEKQWAEIQGRLMVWRRSLESVLQVVRSEREKFLREGPGGNYDDQPQRNGFWNNEGGQRRGGGRRNQGDRQQRGDREQQQQSREVDVGAD
jgi:translation initiation factor 3 subunit M